MQAVAGDEVVNGVVEDGKAADGNGEPGRVKGRRDANAGKGEAEGEEDAADDGHGNIYKEIKEFFNCANFAYFACVFCFFHSYTTFNV